MNETGRGQLDFTKRKEEGLFFYLHLIRPHVTTHHPLVGLGKVLYEHQLKSYLSLADFLFHEHETYVVVKKTPSTARLLSASTTKPFNWHFHLVADDKHGVGINQGFVDIGTTGDEQQVLAKVNSVLSLSQIPEDNLGDKVSHISIFGMSKNRQDDLFRMADQNHTPVLSKFLVQTEIFINIVVSKREDYFHSLCILSPTDIEDQILSFLRVIVSDN